MDKYGRWQRGVQVEKWLTVFEISVHQDEGNERGIHSIYLLVPSPRTTADLFSLPWKIHRGEEEGINAAEEEEGNIRTGR